MLVKDQIEALMPKIIPMIDNGISMKTILRKLRDEEGLKTGVTYFNYVVRKNTYKRASRTTSVILGTKEKEFEFINYIKNRGKKKLTEAAREFFKKNSITEPSSITIFTREIFLKNGLKYLDYSDRAELKIPKKMEQEVIQMLKIMTHRQAVQHLSQKYKKNITMSDIGNLTIRLKREKQHV